MTSLFKRKWKVKEATSINVDLWIATPTDLKKIVAMLDVIQSYVDDVGLCVSVTSTDYRYTNGLEPGFRIGFRNYPRFPSTPLDLLEHAEKLGFLLAEAGDQGSFMVDEVGSCTYWFTRREGD